MEGTNYTQISNYFIDVGMNKYNGSVTKVFIAISRKTIGWHKISDRISYSQLEKLTGMSVNSIKAAITTLIKDGWILQEKTELGYVYDLNIEASKNDRENNSNPEDCQKLIPPLSKIDTPPLSEIDTLALSKNDTTKETLTKEISTKETNTKDTNIAAGKPTAGVLHNFLLSDGTSYPITAEFIAEFQNRYKFNVNFYFKKMENWLIDTPKKRKTKQGIKRFVSNWLNDEETKLNGNYTIQEISEEEFKEFTRRASEYNEKNKLSYNIQSFVDYCRSKNVRKADFYAFYKIWVGWQQQR